MSETDACVVCARNDDSAVNSYSRHPNHVQSDRRHYTDHYRSACIVVVMYIEHCRDSVDFSGQWLIIIIVIVIINSAAIVVWHFLFCTVWFSLVQNNSALIDLLCTNLWCRQPTLSMVVILCYFIYHMINSTVRSFSSFCVYSVAHNKITHRRICNQWSDF